MVIWIRDGETVKPTSDYRVKTGMDSHLFAHVCLDVCVLTVMGEFRSSQVTDGEWLPFFQRQRVMMAEYGWWFTCETISIILGNSSESTQARTTKLDLIPFLDSFSGLFFLLVKSLHTPLLSVTLFHFLSCKPLDSPMEGGPASRQRNMRTEMSHLSSCARICL